jgi:hypothetical protein
LKERNLYHVVEFMQNAQEHLVILKLSMPFWPQEVSDKIAEMLSLLKLQGRGEDYISDRWRFTGVPKKFRRLVLFTGDYNVPLEEIELRVVHLWISMKVKTLEHTKRNELYIYRFYQSFVSKIFGGLN